jgi:hypothetical protein
MENQENQNQEDVNKVKRKEITANIAERMTKVKVIADQLISIVQNSEFNEAELSAAFDMSDGIQEESEEVIMLLFDLKELLPV